MFHAILLPIDIFSDDSWRRAAPVAIRLAKDDAVPLHVITVLPDFGTAWVGSFFREGFEERALHEVGERLTQWVEANVPTDVEVHPHVLHGRVYEEIIHAANRLGTDAIVMGSHRPELSDYLLGPNAARVVRHAKQSVFVVRGD
jgi:nucleotide-binding universal stress UspA family protein